MDIRKLKILNKWYFSNYVKIIKEKDKTIVFNGKTGNIGVIDRSKWNLIERKVDENDKEIQNIILELVNKGCLVENREEDWRNVKTLINMNFFSSNYLNIIILPTEKCNFRCVYCYENFEKGEIKSEVIEGIKNFIYSKIRNLKILSIGWFGGEPLLAFKKMKEILDFSLNVSKKFKVDYFSSISTNGYLLNPYIFQECLKYGISHFQITIDGPPEVHDNRRKTVSGEPTFEKIFNNVKEASKIKRKFKIVIRTNVDQENLPYIPKLLDIFKQNIKNKDNLYFYFRLTFEPGCKGERVDSVKYIERSQEKKILYYLFNETIKRELNYYWDVTSFTPFGSVCYAAQPYSLCIGSDGKIYKCTVHFDKEVNNLGNIFPDGHVEINKEKFIKWVYPYYEDNPKCKSCFYLLQCQNRICPFISMHNPKICDFSSFYFTKYIKKFIENKGAGVPSNKIIKNKKQKGGDKL